MKKLAIIGCSSIGKYHLERLVKFKDTIEFVGFCDLVPEKAQEFCDFAGSGQAFTDYREMYNTVNPDMVFICLPPFAHGEVEYETIRRGIHFFVEKPMALNIELAKDISKKVKEAGLITAVGFQCRYDTIVEPAMRFMKENEIVFVEASRIGAVPNIPWWLQKEKSGGTLVETAIHQCDMIRYLFDEPVEVFSMATRGFVKMEDYNTDDLSVTAVRFKGGALGLISSGCYATEGASFESKITFSAKDKRGIHKILESFEVVEKSSDSGQTDKKHVTDSDGALSRACKSTLYEEKGDAGIICDRTFVEAVVSGDASKIRSPYEDALKSLIFVLSCNKSMETGLAVKIDY